jgi:phosphinothricin acetyltransferase
MNDGPDARARPGSGVARVRRLEPADWDAVAAIYREGLDTGDASFETEVPSWEAWDRTHLPRLRLLAELGGGQVAGWAALSPVSARRTYAGVAEVSIYVARAARGRGVGGALLRALVQGSEDAGIWTLQAGIFPENAASLRLHEHAGFRRVGVRERIGVRAGRWRDVVLLERRSVAVGVP